MDYGAKKVASFPESLEALDPSALCNPSTLSSFILKVHVPRKSACPGRENIGSKELGGPLPGGPADYPQVTLLMGPVSSFSLPSPSPVELREILCYRLDAG